MTSERLVMRSVLGDVAVSPHDVVQAHEHLFARPPSPYDEDADLIIDDVSATAAEVREFVAAGGRTIVDASPRDYGRRLDDLVKVSEMSGAHVIASTGRHKHIYSSMIDSEASVVDMTKEFVADLEHGKGGVRAGVIKVATSEETITPLERAALLAAARASNETGAAITTHLQGGRLGVEQAEILLEAGALPSKVIVGHVDRALDADYHEAILRTGVSIQFDQVGHLKYGSDEARAEAIVELVRRGHGDRICVASDLGRRSYLRAYGGSPGLRHVLVSFLPLLKQAGLSSAEVDRLVADNPARVLAYGAN